MSTVSAFGQQEETQAAIGNVKLEPEVTVSSSSSSSSSSSVDVFADQQQQPQISTTEVFDEAPLVKDEEQEQQTNVQSGKSIIVLGTAMTKDDYKNGRARLKMNMSKTERAELLLRLKEFKKFYNEKRQSSKRKRSRSPPHPENKRGGGGGVSKSQSKAQYDDDDDDEDDDNNNNNNNNEVAEENLIKKEEEHQQSSSFSLSTSALSMQLFNATVGDSTPFSRIDALGDEPIYELPEQKCSLQSPTEFVNLDSHFKEAMQQFKRKRCKPIDSQKLDSYSLSLITRMVNADQRDREANDEGRPGIEKLRLLPEVSVSMTKAYLQEHLVRKDILKILADWIEPLQIPGRRGFSLPAYDIRSAVLDMLLNLPILNDPSKLRKYDEQAWEGVSKEDLQGTTIGKRIHQLSRHKRETRENKDKAEKVIERWSRLIFGVSRDYHRLAEADAERGQIAEDIQEKEWVDPMATLPAELIHSQVADCELEARKERFKRRVRIPSRQLMNFHFRPRSEYTAQELHQREQRATPDEIFRQRLARRVSCIRDENKKCVRSRLMSIEGSLSTMPEGTS